jgi:hypothetical protein
MCHVAKRVSSDPSALIKSHRVANVLRLVGAARVQVGKSLLLRSFWPFPHQAEQSRKFPAVQLVAKH